MAQAVVDLVADTACSRCLVWSKADGLVRLVRELTPKQSIGYIIMPAGNASAQGMRSVRDLLRMPEAEVGTPERVSELLAVATACLLHLAWIWRISPLFASLRLSP